MKLMSVIIFFLSFSAVSGELKNDVELSDKKFQQIIIGSKADNPKLWTIIHEIMNNDINIKISNIKNGSPGKAKGQHDISLNYSHFFKGYKSFSEAKLIVILLHEYGHILYNRNGRHKKSLPKDNEYAAFKYSLLHSIQLAKNGYVDSVQQLQYNLPLRLKKGKPRSPHNLAIKKLMKEKIWKDAIKKYGLKRS